MKVAYRISSKNKMSVKKLSDLPTLVPERQLVPTAENSRSRGKSLSGFLDCQIEGPVVAANSERLIFFMNYVKSARPWR